MRHYFSTCRYIAHVLEEWNDLPFFVQLQGVGIKEGSGEFQYPLMIVNITLM